jgi:hypothetical protein
LRRHGIAALCLSGVGAFEIIREPRAQYSDRERRDLRAR